MSKPDMMAYLRALPLGVRGMGIGDPDDGGRIEAAEVVRWAIGEIERLRLTDAEREVLQRSRQEFPEVIVRRDPTTGESLWTEVATVIDALLERHAP